MKNQKKQKKIKIGIGADHKGFLLKEDLKKWLLNNNFDVTDVGIIDNNERVDYPLYAEKVSRLLQTGKINFGVLVCHTGTGMMMAANRFRGVRALNNFANLEMVRLAREHNDANLIAFGSGFIKTEDAIESLLVFLNTLFSQLPRYQVRNNKLDQFKKIKNKI